MRAGGRPGRARPGPARLGGLAAWRRALRRRRGSGRAPATSHGGGGGCAAPAPAPLLLLQLLPSGKGRAAAAAPPPVPRLPPLASRAQSLSRSLSRVAASSAPRASPIRLPAPSAAARRRQGGGGQDEAGPLGPRLGLRGAGPILRWHRGRGLPRGERASGAEGSPGPGRLAAEMGPGCFRAGEARGVSSSPRVAAPTRTLVVVFQLRCRRRSAYRIKLPFRRNG